MPGHRRKISAASYWPAMIFLAGFSLLLVFIVRSYVIPATIDYRDASPENKRVIDAHSTLLLTILLTILICGLLLTFRFGRLFFPSNRPKPTKTVYTDAWAEAAKRIHVDDES